ncbi:hypothetical protein KSX_27750 [Ktedonospora formicarum]|uniref:Putative sensor domain-containing protein n=2 Tax=Ktedonospora formicarum TaxID=2778364 RepID=A0A8J3HV42_9CHLR|nr:hypothetical protein KSX_27750 [Ktedonospora formicarum]
MSIIYFTLVIVGIALGTGTMVIWIGLPILLASFAMLWGFCALERQMIETMLRMPIPEYPPEVGPMTLRRRFGRYLQSGQTWKGLLYMLFFKLPLSIINFTFVIAVLALALGGVLMPLTYLVTNSVLQEIQRAGHSTPDITYNIGFLAIIANGHFDTVMFIHSLVGIPLGIAFFFLARYVINGLAHISGLIGRVMLGPDTQAMPTPKDDLYGAGSRSQRGYATQETNSQQREAPLPYARTLS